MKRKVIAALALAALSVTMGITAGAEENGKELIQAVYSNTGVLNAHLAAGNNQVAQGLIYDPLVTLNENGIEGVLADSWEISEDGLVYTFHLRDDVVFSDGEPFNADAVKLNIDAVQENKDAYSWMGLVGRIVSTDVIDDYTVSITLSEPYYPTLQELSYTRPYRFMSPNSFIDGHSIDGITEAIGTGAYKLVESVDDQYAVFEVNENYWGEEPAIKKITRKILPDSQTAFLAMQKGETNFIFTDQGSNIIDNTSANMLSDGDYQIVISEPAATRILLTNTGCDSPISEKAVRLALWQAIDRDTLSEVVFDGEEESAYTLEYKGLPYCGDFAFEERLYDPEAAAAILDEAGWVLEDGAEYRTKDGKELEILLYFFADKANHKTVCELLQDNAKASGIKLTLVGEDSSSIYARRKSGEFELLFDSTWGVPYEPYMTANILTPGGSYEYASQGMEDPEGFYDLVHQMLTGTDEEERQELMTEIFEKVHDEATLIPLTYMSLKIVAPKDMENLHFYMSQYELPYRDFSFAE